MFVVIACVLIPRFGLVAAVAGRRELLARPVALAPEPGGPQVVGEVSGAAEAFGITRGDAAGRGARPLPRAGADPARPGARRGGLGGAAGAESRRSGRRSSHGVPASCSSGSTACAGCWGRPERALERARRVVGRGARLGAGPDPALRAGGGAALAPASRRRRRRRACGEVVPGAAADRDPARPAGRRPSRLSAAGLGFVLRTPPHMDRSEPRRHPRAAGGRHAGRAGGAARLRRGRPVRRRGHEGARDGARHRGAAAPAPASRGASRGARAAGRRHRRSARTRAGAAGRPAAGEPRCAVVAASGACAWRRAWPAAAAGGSRPS